MAGKSKIAWGIDVGQYGLRAIKLEAVGIDLGINGEVIHEYLTEPGRDGTEARRIDGRG